MPPASNTANNPTSASRSSMPGSATRRQDLGARAPADLAPPSGERAEPGTRHRGRSDGAQRAQQKPHTRAAQAPAILSIGSAIRDAICLPPPHAPPQRQSSRTQQFPSVRVCLVTHRCYPQHHITYAVALLDCGSLQLV